MRLIALIIMIRESYEHFYKAAAEGEDFEGNATVDASAAALGLKSQKDILPGLTITLLPHQLIGVAWMIQQESEPVSIIARSKLLLNSVYVHKMGKITAGSWVSLSSISA